MPDVEHDEAISIYALPMLARRLLRRSVPAALLTKHAGRETRHSPQ
jgi:hypothetical protein